MNRHCSNQKIINKLKEKYTDLNYMTPTKSHALKRLPTHSFSNFYKKGVNKRVINDDIKNNFIDNLYINKKTRKSSKIKYSFTNY